MSRHPLVKWAQRSDKLFITVELPDAKNVKLNLDPEGKFFFSGTSGVDNALYELDIVLYDKVDVNESKASFTSRNICYLVKKAESQWWSRLLKQEGKPPAFLKVDWDKWVDEDEQDGQPGENMDFGDFDLSKLNMGGAGDFDDDIPDGDEDDESDSDDENKGDTNTADGGPEAAPATNTGSKTKA
ncbi:prostaglandin E synthase 3 [Striga asiatica]|uniref:Co-chaperone protein p23 n=1 Tax=Striga asiatica TaxID=4170 RepID=A0A5A7QG15_STRAF|nr:prostaglandin E synthase 3 [Striga asiatica]